MTEQTLASSSAGFDGGDSTTPWLACRQSLLERLIQPVLSGSSLLLVSTVLARSSDWDLRQVDEASRLQFIKRSSKPK